MKTFRNLQTESFPVTPKKAFKGWPYAYSEPVDDEIELTFCNDSTNRVYIADEGQIIYDIEQIPDDIYDTNDNVYLTFLYDLNELNQISNLQNPLQCLYDDYGIPEIRQYGNNLNKWNSSVLLIDDKYYVWFQDRD